MYGQPSFPRTRSAVQRNISSASKSSLFSSPHRLRRAVLKKQKIVLGKQIFLPKPRFIFEARVVSRTRGRDVVHK
jgi:hypothetical protein